MAVCGSVRCAGWRENTQQGTLATGVARVRGASSRCPVGGSVADGASGREWNGSQPGQGAAELPQEGQRTKMLNRRADSRPAREKNRRRRVLVVAIRSPRPIRAVIQRARLVWTASQAPLAAKRPVRGEISARRRTWRVWHSRSRRGGDGQPPVRATPRPGR